MISSQSNLIRQIKNQLLKAISVDILHPDITHTSHCNINPGFETLNTYTVFMTLLLLNIMEHSLYILYGMFQCCTGLHQGLFYSCTMRHYL